MSVVLHLLILVRALAEDRRRLALENLALRHQVAVLKRSVKRPRIHDSDRVFWILMRRTLAEWRDTLHFVKPETVIRWHRKGFKYYWRRRSNGRCGRPPIGQDVIHLIRRLSLENRLWGAPRIQAELAPLGHDVAESTVAKYMVKQPERGPSQTWRTFLANHMGETAACDFFTVPTATFKVLYCFVVLSLDRRRIVHINVTDHPTAAWTARQLIEAFPGGMEPRFLMRDRDGAYDWEFIQAVKTLGVTEVISAARSPWQNCFVERVIGTIRRECTDHVIPFGRRHLLGILREYVGYYHESRPHQSLGRNSPEPRRVEAIGELSAKPVLGGLHHRYSRAA